MMEIASVKVAGPDSTEETNPTQTFAISEEPQVEDVTGLLRVTDHVPLRAFLAALLGMIERFTFYGIMAPMQNYMQNSGKAGLVPGALNLGQSRAASIYYAFLAFTYVSPIPAAIVADCWLGRFKTIVLSICIYSVGTLLIFVTSLPYSLRHGAGIGGLVAGLILIAFGVGGMKATIPPFIMDQYTETIPRVRETKKGERVVTDRNLTMQYLYNVYYWLINVASLSMIATTYLERRVGFWAAFLLPSCVFWSMGIVIMLSHRKFRKQLPEENVLLTAFKILAFAAKNGCNLDTAKAQPSTGSRPGDKWTPKFIDELRVGLKTAKLMFAFSVVWLCVGQMSNNLVSQAGEMITDNFPNDALPAINPIACIFLGPLILKALYPFLLNRGISFRPIARVTVGFIFIALGMSYAAILQSHVYHSSPCFDHPLACPSSKNGEIPNQISVWLQIPIYVSFAAGEILCVVTGMEYAYAKAPKDVRSLVQAMGILTAGIGAAVGAGISQVATDPHLVTMYAVLAGVMGLTAGVFWIIFSKYDDVDEEMNRVIAE